MRQMARVGSVFGALWLAASGSLPLAAQSPVTDRLAAAKALKCAFPVMAVGAWNGAAAAGEIKPASLNFDFVEIDPDEGTARIVGPFGPSDIVVRLSSGTLHFMQSFREGPLYATSVFAYEVAPGRLRAVHTRHEYTPVSLPGFTSRPEQYYGTCEISR
jgi:hypothetical protein